MKTFSTGDIAKFCDVNLRTVIRWIEKGDLEGFKLPGRGNNRVTEKAFLTFLHRYNIPIPDELKACEKVNSGRILIVDDEAQIAKAIQRVLRGAGYETSLAYDGFRAGSQLVKERPALMTLDLSMPGIDGYEVIKFVRSSEGISDTRILVISALDEDRLEEALACGADACLQKPFANSELLAVIEKLLRPSVGLIANG
jgi:CheY-like chemotaxis protein